MDDARPLFVQISEQIEGQIVDGSMREESQVPSINELASFNRINPATALKGVSKLVDAGILYKRRGIGMFVAEGARARLLAGRREAFTTTFIRPLIAEAAKLDIGTEQLTDMIKKESRS